jgi:hypothetical protein
LLDTLRSARQAARADGNLHVALLRDRHRTFWTSTSWSSDDALKAFMHAKPHGPTMRKLLEWCDEASLVRWTQPQADLPTWDEAFSRLQQDGRPSKVQHPSSAHIAQAFPAPVAGRTRDLHIR